MCECCGNHDHQPTIQVITPKGADQTRDQADQATEEESD